MPLFRDSIDFGHKQLCISEELDSPNMRAEAYLNLARAHERLGALDRALDYARHRYPYPFAEMLFKPESISVSFPRSLYNERDQYAIAGLVHLTVGRVHLELAGFCKALEAFQRAHKIAHSIQDPSLELQVGWPTAAPSICTYKYARLLVRFAGVRRLVGVVLQIARRR